MRLSIVKIAYVVGVSLLLATTSAAAENFPSFSEVWQKSQSLRPQPSMDTTPVTIKVAEVVYRIPRNYLAYLPPMTPTLRVSFPGFRPLAPETRTCFDPKQQVKDSPCRAIDVMLFGSHGPKPDGSAYTQSERFENLVRGMKVISRSNYAGYELFEVGPYEATTQIFRKIEGDILFTCFLQNDANQKRGGVCDDLFTLEDKNSARFRFQPYQIEHVQEIETGIRELMRGFFAEATER